MKARTCVRFVALAVALYFACSFSDALCSEAKIEFVRTQAGSWSEEREYTATWPGETRKFRFTASHTADNKLVDPREWTLSLHGVWVEPEDAKGTGTERRAAMEAANQDPFVSSEIVGENGLLQQCIRKLREDVPDARLHGLSLDMRCYYECWPELRKLLVPTVKRMEGTSTIMGPPGGNAVVEKYKKGAKPMLEIGNRVARWTDTTFDRTVWDHDHGLRARLDFIGRPASAMLEDRHLGLDISSLSFEFLFKPKEVAKPAGPKSKRP
ncbi:MAG TPA: hypothetical protein VGO11_12650 [Chthoniobacteraceae bacterium]|jgi:hypothetical protein|nr:hypothetical protein [Chthoniobacteraceae bacterium]